MCTGNAEINILSIVLFLLLIFHSKTALREKKSHSYFYKVIYFIILTLAADTMFYFMEKTASPGAIFIHYLSIIACSLSTVISAYFWLIYVHSEVLQTNPCNSVKRVLYLLPLLFWSAVVLSSPFSHWIFFVDDKNQYTQGILYFLHDYMIYGYILISAIIAFERYTKATLLENRKLCLHLFLYSLIPLLGKGIEVIYPRFHIAVSTIVISIVTLYLNNLKKEIFLDPLTQLYNRRQFQQYLIKLTKYLKREKIFLVFFDINDFKMINDAFGHVIGDEALIIVSQVLKSVFSDTKAFLARYGGDEFAVILSKKEEKDILSYLNKVDYSLFEISKDLPYNLFLSMGYSIYGKDEATTIESLVQAADKKMYYDKQEKKNNFC